MQQSVVAEFASLATRFCELIEVHASMTEREFLGEVDVVLPRLYSAAARLHTVVPASDRMLQHNADVYLDTIELVNSLEAFLVTSDHYRKLLSPYSARDEEEVIEGCLATELMHLYGYLKPTLGLGTGSDYTTATIATWANVVWLQGEMIVEAMTAIHFALHQN